MGKSTKKPAKKQPLIKLLLGQPRSKIIAVGTALIVTLSFGIIGILKIIDDPKVTAVTPGQETLQNQVDGSDGAPRSGRDPANQKQNSLASAASQPTGTGKRVTKPAAGVTGSNVQNNQPANNNAAGSGIGTNGCYVDYGKQGEQCVPVHAATNGVLTCDGVRTHGGFPNGVIVSGTDRFNLDTNKDGIACNSGD